MAGAWFSGLTEAPAQIAGYIAWFAVLCAASIALWASAGGLLRRWLQDARRLKAFNLGMGALLAASALTLVH